MRISPPAFLLGLLVSTGLLAQHVVAPPRPQPPRLEISSPDTRTPVRLDGMSVDVEVAGQVVTTSYLLTLGNPNRQVMEGVIEFPLAAGQQVVGLALDIDGEMRDAVAVPKDKGRAVFEAITRRQVDPALLEQTGGNSYRLRVYPVPPGGTRRARITVMEAPLVRDGKARLALGIVHGSGLDSVPLTVHGLQKLDIEGSRKAHSPVLQRPILSANLSPADYPHAATLVWPVAGEGAERLIQRDDGEDFAVVSFRPAAAAVVTASIPSLGLLWDASLSGADRDHSLEIASLERLLAAAGTREVSLIVLRDRPEPPRTFRIANGDSAELRHFLQQLVYDGASNPGGWSPPAGVSRWLYVGDGRFNYGNARMPTFDGVRIDALSDARSDPDASRLANWSEASGGKHVAITGTVDVEAAALRLLRDPARIERLEVLGGGDAVSSSIWPEADGRFRVALRASAPDARLVVHWRDAAGLHAQSFDLGGEAGKGRLAGRLWAQWTMRVLENDPLGNRARLQQLGQRFGIVNAETSLIVLETLDDYLRYEIVPPSSLRAGYEAALKQQNRVDRKSRQQRLDVMAERMSERIRWWQKEWPKGEPAPLKADIKRWQAADAAVSLAQPEMAPPPPSPAQAMKSAALDRVEITGSRMRSVADAPAQATSIPATDAVIHIQPWQSDSPAARRMHEARPAHRYAVYLDERTRNRQSPAFYLDAAQALKDGGERDLALRVLSNLAELQIEDRHLLRVLAYRLSEMDAAQLAVPLLLRVRALADDEPQSHRDLGLALARTGHYQDAADSLYRVVSGEWDDRFSGVAMIALVELNGLIARHPGKITTSAYDQRLLRNLPLGLRTVLSWDADNSDMDLWVTDPNGEKAFYGNRQTYQGGRMSEDFTGGYGPEEFAIRIPKPGTYKVEVNYFGDRQQIVTGETTLQLWLSTGFGTPAQKDQVVSVRLKSRSDTVLVGEFEVK